LGDRVDCLFCLSGGDDTCPERLKEDVFPGLSLPPPPPSQAHKSHGICFGICGVDVGFDNPVFASLEVCPPPHPPAGASGRTLGWEGLRPVALTPIHRPGPLAWNARSRSRGEPFHSLVFVLFLPPLKYALLLEPAWPPPLLQPSKRSCERVTVPCCGVFHIDNRF